MSLDPNYPYLASEHQEGGEHYKLPIQPFEFIYRNNIGFAEGNVIKYVCRWRKKNGIEDLKKAKHYIDLMIEQELKAQHPLVAVDALDDAPELDGSLKAGEWLKGWQ